MTLQTHEPPFRVLVADDEPNAREGLVRLLASDEEVRIVAECDSGPAASNAVLQCNPEIAFLDIYMPGRSGLEMLADVGRERMPAVVLVTAYAEHALEAFESCVLDYLLKPFTDARFRDSLERAKQRARQWRLTGAKTAFLDRILATVGSRSVPIRVEDVDWIEGAGYYSRVHVGARSYLVRRSLHSFESLLDPSQFVRVHKSAIIKLDRAKALLPGDASDSAAFFVKLENGVRVPVSRRGHSGLTRALGKLP